MLGDVLAEGATLFGSILNNLRRVVIRLKVDISSCGMKHGNYLAAVVVILVMLLGLGRRQGEQTKNSYPGGSDALGGGDIGDTGIGRLVVTEAVDILPAKVSQGLVRLISRFVASISNPIPGATLSSFLRRHFFVVTQRMMRSYIDSVFVCEEIQVSLSFWDAVKGSDTFKHDTNLRLKSLRPLTHLPDLPPIRNMNFSLITVVHTISPFRDYSMRSGVLGYEPIDSATA